LAAAAAAPGWPPWLRAATDTGPSSCRFPLQSTTDDTDNTDERKSGVFLSVLSVSSVVDFSSTKQCRDAGGLDQAAGVGDAAAGDVVGGAVGDAGPDQRQADRDV